MIELRTVTTDEMVLAFLQGEAHSPTSRGQIFANGLAHIGADIGYLIDRGDLTNEQDNYTRRWLLGYARGYGLNLFLFLGFPIDTSWRLVVATPAEIRTFRYANCDPWVTVSGVSRRVAEGAKNLDHEQNASVKKNVVGIVERLRKGERFPALIAVQRTGSDELLLAEGHTRATAYALSDLPDEIEVIVGTSMRMGEWMFF